MGTRIQNQEIQCQHAVLHNDARLREVYLLPKLSLPNSLSLSSPSQLYACHLFLLLRKLFHLSIYLYDEYFLNLSGLNPNLI